MEIKSICGFWFLEDVSTSAAAAEYEMDFSVKRFTQLLKNTSKFWLKPAFYHFTIEFSTQETITTKTKHLCFFGIFFKAKVEIIKAATYDTESYFPTLEQKDWLEF